MEIRTATKEDLPRIMELGVEFNHLMVYQKDPMMVGQYLDRILVATETLDVKELDSIPPLRPRQETEIVGYYHYIVSGDPGFEEMLRCYRQFPQELISEALWEFSGPLSGLCICMQGASHREVFTEFIKYLQERYLNIWNYCSIKSRRVDTYKSLGFSYNPDEAYTFFNVSKGDFSTYLLGRWRR